MKLPCNGCAARAVCQPHGEEHVSDGVGVKEMIIPKSGTIVPQHSHEYEHISYVARGLVKVSSSDKPGERFIKAPAAINIPAGVKHTFTSLVDDCLVLCIHNVSRNGTFEVREEHQIIG